MGLADRLGRRLDELRGGAPARLRAAGEVLVRASVAACSEPGSADAHSRPGEAPRRRTGRLAAGFRAEVRGDSVVLVNDAPHARYVAATRDLARGVEDSRAEVRRILLP